MARAVVLDFKDDQAAEKFCEMILEVQGNPNKGVPMDISMVAVAHAKIVALLPRPVRGCECHRKGRVQGWSRDPGTNWFVCPQCFRPHKTVVRNWYVNLCSPTKNRLRAIKDRLVAEANPPEVVGSDNSGGDVLSTHTPEGSVDVSEVRGNTSEATQDVGGRGNASHDTGSDSTSGNETVPPESSPNVSG